LNSVPTSFYTKDPEPGIRILGIEPPLFRRIVHLGWPVIIGMLSQTAINTVDLLFIGRLPGDIAVPGAAAIFSSVILIWVFGGFLSAISVGTQAISARRFSEGQFGAAGKVLTNSLAVAIVSSVVMFFLVYPFAGDLFSFLTPSERERVIGESYTNIRFLGLPAMAMMAAYKSFYDGLGRVRVHMAIAIVMNISNAVLCYLLIFGFSIFGFTVPPLSINGAAIAAVIASYLGLLIMMFWTLRKEDRRAFGVYRFANLDRGVAIAVARLSVWSGLATVVLMAGVGLFKKIVSTLDQIENLQEVNSASASIIINIMLLVFMTCLAFGTSTATLVSQSVGAKNFGLASRYGWQSALIAIYGVTIFGIIVFIYPEPVLHFFMPHEANTDSLKNLVVAHAMPSLRLVVAVLSPIAGGAMVLTQALYGAGKTRYVLIAEFLLHFFVLVPLAYILSIVMGWGLIGCWIAGIAYGLGLLIATGVAFAAGKWKETVI
jgi:MATE family multidrug resistance protein